MYWSAEIMVELDCQFDSCWYVFEEVVVVVVVWEDWLVVFMTGMGGGGGGGGGAGEVYFCSTMFKSPFIALHIVIWTLEPSARMYWILTNVPLGRTCIHTISMTAPAGFDRKVRAKSSILLKNISVW
jgi:hypothetical protein